VRRGWRLSEAKLHALQIEKLKYTIAKLRHQQFDQSSERRDPRAALGAAAGCLRAAAAAQLAARAKVAV
jgi:hypothetical protein